jgi:hypothetical protein
VCVTRDQFAEVFGNQSALAGQAAAGAVIGESAAPTASPAPLGGDADTATTTTPAVPEPITSDASSTPELDASNDNDAADDTLLIDTPAAPEPEASAAEPQAANDNEPQVELGATGTE